MRITMTSTSLGILVAVLAAAPATAVNMYCVDRDGRCMAVTVNGQKAVKLGKATKKELAAMDIRGAEMRSYMKDVRYEVTQPVRGDLDVQADADQSRKAARDWFGESRTSDVMVVPLGGVELKTRQQVGAASGVSVGGAAPLVVQNVLEGKRLPPGSYLLIVRLSGEENWDRMTLFVRVAE